MTLRQEIHAFTVARVLEELSRHGGNRMRAGRSLGFVSRSHMSVLIRRLGITLPPGKVGRPRAVPERSEAP